MQTRSISSYLYSNALRRLGTEVPVDRTRFWPYGHHEKMPLEAEIGSAAKVISGMAIDYMDRCIPRSRACFIQNGGRRLFLQDLDFESGDSIR